MNKPVNTYAYELFLVGARLNEKQQRALEEYVLDMVDPSGEKDITCKIKAYLKVDPK